VRDNVAGEERAKNDLFQMSRQGFEAKPAEIRFWHTLRGARGFGGAIQGSRELGPSSGVGRKWLKLGAPGRRMAGGAAGVRTNAHCSKNLVRLKGIYQAATLFVVGCELRSVA